MSILRRLAAAVVVIAGCADQGMIVDDVDDGEGEGEAIPVVTDDPPMDEQTIPLDDVFAAAAAEFGVPADLLKAIGYAETRWEMVAGAEEFDGQPAAFGLMALRGEAITRGAALLGVDSDDVRWDEAANIRAAAALLSSFADDLAIDRADLGAWAPAVARLAGIPDEEGVRSFVVDEVYGVLQDGVAVTLETGMVRASIEAIDVVPDFPAPEGTPRATTDYAGAIWRPSPNYNSRPGGAIGKVGMVIIHTCEGAYSGCWGWLRNTAAVASAHYVVNSTGSEISQLVREANRAWHIAADYACSRNGSVECWRNGSSSNHFTVGIEHAGFASQSSWPNGQIEASARLVCDITRDHGIPRDRFHIVGHGKLQPWNRVDPGPNWPWTHYLDRIRAICGGSDGGGGTPPPSGGLVVDSNNANNDRAKGYVEVSANWTASSATTGYYGSGYWWASNKAISDGASFSFYMPSAGSKTLDAWWTAGSNRSASTPFVVFNAAGTKLGTAFKDQRSAGSRWNTLGTYAFSAGWNRVVVSRWTSSAGVVVADAIRVR